MKWTALVPLKSGVNGKSRLSPYLRQRQRNQLREALARHVLGRLERASGVGRVIVVSSDAAMAFGREWHCAPGHGLNEDLEHVRARLGATPLLVVHGDLPCLRTREIAALIRAGASGQVALAPDIHNTGTNAIALHASPEFRFQFGVDSFRKHQQSATGGWRRVRRAGLCIDIDTPEDLKTITQRQLAPGIAAMIRRL